MSLRSLNGSKCPGPKSAKRQGEKPGQPSPSVLLSDRPIAATYVRISDPDDVRTASLESQEEQAVAKLEAAGFQVPMEYRFREQYTGMESIYDRPVLMRIRDLIDDGEIKAVCCYETGRLARDPNELMTWVFAARRKKVEVLFVMTNHEFETRIGQAMLYISGLATALEWDAIKDRTARGRMKMLSSGRLLGGGPVRYGYRFDVAARSRTADPETAPVVVKVFELSAAGHSAVQICKILDDEGIPTPSMRRRQQYKDGRGQRWSLASVMNMIRCRDYIGECTARKTMPSERRRANGRRIMVPRPASEQVVLTDHRTEPLVSRELFDAANANLVAQRTVPKGDYVSNHLLSGFIYCGQCGRRMTPVTDRKYNPIVHGVNKGTSRCYRCTGDFPSRKDRNGCKVVVGAVKVDKKAWEIVEGVIRRPALIERELARLDDHGVKEKIESDLAAAEKDKAALARKLKSILATFGETESQRIRDAIKDQVHQIDEKCKRADKQIEMLHQRLRPFVEARTAKAGVLANVEELRRKLEASQELTVKEKRKFLEWLGARVVASRGAVVTVQLDVRFKDVKDAHANGDSTTTGTRVVCSGEMVSMTFAYDAVCA